MRHKRTGFTLIELLVVIAIIAILAGILFPVFARAKKTALSVSCLSNIKQLGTACKMYMDDNKSTLPTFKAPSTQNWMYWYQVYVGYFPIENQAQLDFATTQSIRAQLGPYVKSENIWKCPSDANCDAAAFNKIVGANGPRWTSYCYRSLVTYYSAFNRALKESDFAESTKFRLFTELMPYHDFRFVQNLRRWPFCFEKTSQINLAFVDGHAARHPIDKSWWRDTSLKDKDTSYYELWPRIDNRGVLYGPDVSPPNWRDLD